MNSPIVIAIARALHEAESRKQRTRICWDRLPENRRTALCAIVRDVLLAAQDVGYVLTRSPEIEIDTIPAPPSTDPAPATG